MPPSEHAQAFGHAVGEIWKSMQGLSLPLPALSALQAEYLKQATEMWNSAVERARPGHWPAAAHRRPPLRRRRLGRQPGRGLTAQIYLLNARTLMKMADAVEGDAKTKARIRFAVQQWIDAASPSNYLALNPEAQRKALETKGESIAQGMQAPAGRHPAGPCLADRRERVRGRPQRGHHRGRGGVRERAVPAARIQAADRQGARAADAVRAAVHQQVLHPRPAARQLADPLHGGAGPPHLRRELAQPRRVDGRQDLGRLHRARRDPRHPRWCRTSPAADTINTLGFCVGGTILATALAVLAARGEQPARQRDAADHAARLHRHRRARPVHRRAGGAVARDDARRPRRPTAPACSRARNWPPPSASCARTTWSGTTSSATT